MAGAFLVMSFGVRALDKEDVDPAFMSKLAKISTTEIISSKVFFILKLSVRFLYSFFFPIFLVVTLR